MNLCTITVSRTAAVYHESYTTKVSIPKGVWQELGLDACRFVVAGYDAGSSVLYLTPGEDTPEAYTVQGRGNENTTAKITMTLPVDLNRGLRKVLAGVDVNDDGVIVVNIGGGRAFEGKTLRNGRVVPYFEKQLDGA